MASADNRLVRHAVLLVLVVAFAVAAPKLGARPDTSNQQPAASNQQTAASNQQPAASNQPQGTSWQARFAMLEWRHVGPFRGGRTVGAAGVAQQPNVFYIGVNNG